MRIGDDRSPINRPRIVVLSAAVVLALLLLATFVGWTYVLVVSAGMFSVGLILRLISREFRLFWWRPDPKDLVTIAGLYLAVVGANRLAFVGFTTDNMLGLFLSYAVVGLLMLGVVGPVVYTVWWRSRPLRSLGVGLHEWRPTVLLGLVFAAVQFSLTLWGYDLPQPVDWIPLLLMSLTVGMFESIFFRGFIQNRLEASFGPVAGIGSAAVLYGLYHFGYGMGAEEIVFLTGLGVVYAVAFATTRNMLVLWPLLTPLGSLYNNLEAGDIELPWASMAGFGQVLVAMGVVLWFAHLHAARKDGSKPIVERNQKPMSTGSDDSTLVGAETRR